MEPNKIQNLAITYNENKNVLVSAGAGSGKTFVLTKRVLEFITNHNYTIDDFLILTFTNLAANSMKEKIRKALEKEELVDELEKLDTADICTFDAFAFSLVKKYHNNLKLSSNIKILDSNFIKIKEYEFLEKIMDEYYLANDEDFLKLVDLCCFKDDNSLKDAIVKFYDSTKSSLVNINQYLKDFAFNYYQSKEFEEFLIKSLLKYVDDNVKYCLNIYENHSDIFVERSKNKTNVSEKMMDFINKRFNTESYEKLISTFLESSSLKGISLKKEKDEYPFFMDAENIITKLKNFVKLLPSTKEEFIANYKTNEKYFNVVAEIIKKLDGMIKSFKDKYQAYEFSDIANKALELLKNNEEIRNQLKNKYKMIIIDEYQDTNDIQEEFISYIANNNLFMVGDVKQAIYGFRNANCKIFLEKYNDYRKNYTGRVIDMNTNYRSRNEVIEDTNYIFERLMTNETCMIDYKYFHKLESGANYKKPTNNQNNNLEFIICKGNGADKKIKNQAIEIAKDIINRIKNKYQVCDENGNLRDCTYKDFCILSNKVKDIDEVFASVFEDYNLPLFIQKDKNVLENDVFLMIKNLLIVVNSIISNEKGDLKQAFISLTRSFVFEYSDEEIYNALQNKIYEDKAYKQIQEIINKNKNLSLSNLIENIIYELDIYHKLVLIGNVDDNTRTINYLINDIKNMESFDYSLADIIKHFDLLSAKEIEFNVECGIPESNTVKLMSIHKSKGLEFNIVYHALLEKGFNTKAENDPLIVSKQFGLIFKKNSSYLCDFNNMYKKDDIYSEKIRLFYVALTRAKEKNILLLAVDNKQYDEYKFDNSDNLIYLKKDNIELEDIIDSKSFLDYIIPFIEYNKFNSYKLDDIANEMIKNNSEDKYDIENITFESKEINNYHASKAIEINSNEKNMEFGTKLHFALEITDFKNPDYSKLNSFEANIIKKFLNASFNKNINEANIYKEYEFIDDINNIHGIIDLMLVYNDHIDIIDYKSKSISDEAYIKQLSIYKDYIKKSFNLETHAYLYSLINANYKNVDKEIEALTR